MFRLALICGSGHLAVSAGNAVQEVMIPMRDGVKLYTTVQLPKSKGKFPVIIYRNPYRDKTDFNALIEENIHGYAVVSQHCRGTGQSEGVFVSYRNEHNDGLDLLEWVRKQPFYNGEIFLAGTSYASSVHLSYMGSNPPDIKGAVLNVQDQKRYNIVYRNGFYKTGGWGFNMHRKNNPPQYNWSEDIFRTMPLKGLSKKVFGEIVPHLEEVLMHPDPADEFWRTPEGGADFSDAVSRSNIPVLLVTSHYDIYLGGICDMWNSLPPERKKECAMVITPYNHNFDPAPDKRKNLLMEFPNGSLKEMCGGDYTYMWFDNIRKNSPLRFVEKGKVKYYTMFENVWHTADTLADAPNRKYFYLQQDRSLQQEAGETGEITYLYNPYAPAKFKGGTVHGGGILRVQDKANSRYDIISFVSKPFAEDAVYEGRGEVVLHCRSTAPDTCFYVRLNLVRKGGKALNMRDDIDSLCRVEKEYTPGGERVLRFILPEHSFKIAAGDRLRLDVSSSCVPYFQVHTNRKGLLALHEKADCCYNTVITGKSHMILPFRSK